jgi:hypothetical protein
MIRIVKRALSEAGSQAVQAWEIVQGDPVTGTVLLTLTTTAAGLASRVIDDNLDLYIDTDAKRQISVRAKSTNSDHYAGGFAEIVWY